MQPGVAMPINLGCRITYQKPHPAAMILVCGMIPTRLIVILIQWVILRISVKNLFTKAMKGRLLGRVGELIATVINFN